MQLVKTTGEQIHNSYNDTALYESNDLWNLDTEFPIDEMYWMRYTVTTMNGITLQSPRYRIAQSRSINPGIDINLIATCNAENGYVRLSMTGATNVLDEEVAVTGTFRILRTSSDEDYSAWHEVHRFALYGAQPAEWEWKDMTVHQGRYYKYEICQYTDKIASNGIESNEVYVDFDHAFLYDGERQLKIKFNPKVASFKNDVLEAKMDTIGGQYPFIFRNGNVKYKEFSLSGLLSLQMDDENLFFNAFNEDYHRTETPNGRTDFSKQNLKPLDLNAKNFADERDFKLEVLEWLNNGKPKLYRSPAEGTYIVRIMNVSMSPNDTLGRMLHTFTGTAYEIAEYSYDSLASYGFIDIDDPNFQQLRWETIDLSKSGLAMANNLISHVAVALKFEGMVPGDRVYIQDGITRTYETEDGTEYTQGGFNLTIGATGSYELSLSNGAEISVVKFLGSPIDNTETGMFIVQHQGQLSYAYYSDSQSRFSLVDSVTIHEAGARQFIGKYENIIDEIEDVKTSIGSIYLLRFERQDVEAGGKVITGKTYTEEFAELPKIFVEFQNNRQAAMSSDVIYGDQLDQIRMYDVNPLEDESAKPFYACYKTSHKVPTGWSVTADGELLGSRVSILSSNESFGMRVLKSYMQTYFQKASYAVEVITDVEDSNRYYIFDSTTANFNNATIDTYYTIDDNPYRVIINGDEKGQLDLTETMDFEVQNPKDIKSIQTSDGIITNISYQEVVANYAVELDDEIVHYPNLYAAKLALENAKSALITEQKDSLAPESDVDSAYQLYKYAYEQYINELEYILEEEEWLLGDRTEQPAK